MAFGEDLYAVPINITISINFVTTHASFKTIGVLIETYAIRLEWTCKFASAASLRIFCYSYWMKFLLGKDSELFVMFTLMLVFCYNIVTELVINFVSLVFPPA